MKRGTFIPARSHCSGDRNAVFFVRRSHLSGGGARSHREIDGATEGPPWSAVLPWPASTDEGKRARTGLQNYLYERRSNGEKSFYEPSR